MVEGFDTHVREQLPWYELASDMAIDLARHYAESGCLVYDVGSSTGNIMRRASAALPESEVVGIEPSGLMAKSSGGSVLVAKAEEVSFRPFGVAICFLSILFMAPSKRRVFIDYLKSRVIRGGAIIIVDKDSSVPGYLAKAFWRSTLSNKLKHGAEPSDVTLKELSLIGVQRPLEPRDMGEGFVEWFRLGEWVGYIYEA